MAPPPQGIHRAALVTQPGDISRTDSQAWELPDRCADVGELAHLLTQQTWDGLYRVADDYVSVVRYYLTKDSVVLKCV